MGLNSDKTAKVYLYYIRNASTTQNFVRIAPQVFLQHGLQVLHCLGGDALLFLVTGRPAHSASMPVLFLLSGPKMGFSPRMSNTLPR